MFQSCAEADGDGAGAGDGAVLSCFKAGHEEDPSAATNEGRARLSWGSINFMYRSKKVPSFPFFDLNFQEVNIT